MKAKTAIHLIGGEVLRTPTSFDQMCVLWATMANSRTGSAYGVEVLTGHGTIRRAALQAGTIFRLEEL